MAIPVTSGTTNFLPSVGELVLNAYGRIGYRRAEIQEEEMINARMMVNLMLADWSIDVPNLWKVSLVTTTLLNGVATYSVDSTTIAILDAYVGTAKGDGTYTDIIILPISRSEYAAFPDKKQAGRSTTFWFDRLLSPTITTWPVTDQDNTYILRYYAVTQIFDANYTSGQQADLPYRFLEAFGSGLAAKLAEIYPPKNGRNAQDVQAIASRAYTRATQQDSEMVPLFIVPMIGSFYR